MTLPITLVALAGAVLGVGETEPGLYEWRDRTAAVATGMTLVLPLLCGVAAFAGARLRTSTFFTMIRLSRDGGLRAALALVAGVTCTVAGAFTVLAVGAFVPWGSPRVPSGGPEWSWLLSTFVSLLAGVLIGLVVGLLLPGWWSAPAICLVTYAAGVVILVAGGAASPTTPVLSPLFVASLGPFYRLNAGLFETRSIFFSAVSLVAIAFVLQILTRSRRVTLVAGSVGTLVSILSATSVVTSPAGVTLDTPNASSRCAGSRPQLCLIPAFEPERSALREALTPLQRRLAGTPFTFDRVELTQRGAGGEAPAGTAALHVDDFAEGWQSRDLGEFVQTMLDSRRPGDVCSRLGPPQPADFVPGPPLVFVAWAVGDRAITDAWEGGGAAYDKLISLSITAQRAWVTRSAADLCAGRAPLAELG